MAAALTLQACGADPRPLVLYDTFEGMSEPTQHDREVSGRTAAEALAKHSRASTVWAVAGLDEVRRNVASTGYPADLVTYVQGKVEDTRLEARDGVRSLGFTPGQPRLWAGLSRELRAWDLPRPEPVAFQDGHSPGRLRSIRSPMSRS